MALRVLILFAHPALQKSRIHRRLIPIAKQTDGVTFHDLYEAYPELDIDVQHEQELLLQHQVVVFQHPVYWYSTPAILKEWQDLVLEHGWAYGRSGIFLKGKWFLNICTTGGPQQAYAKEGRNRFTMRELLSPMEQTAFLCGMQFLPPYVIHGAHVMEPDAFDDVLTSYQMLLSTLVNGEIDPLALQHENYLNPFVSTGGM